MGSQCSAEFLNEGKNTVSGFYNRIILNGDEETVTFTASPSKKFQIAIGFAGFNYYYMSINQEGDKGKTNYFEIRSVADFLLLEQVLEKKYSLKMLSARPHYKDFW